MDDAASKRGFEFSDCERSSQPTQISHVARFGLQSFGSGQIVDSVCNALYGRVPCCKKGFGFGNGVEGQFGHGDAERNVDARYKKAFELEPWKSENFGKKGLLN